MTDTERLDALDEMTGSYSGRVALRWSTTGRGWRLHETSREDASRTVREAIDKFFGEWTSDTKESGQ